MEKDKYFSTLLNLYEAVSAEDAQRRQQNIADTGEDVEDPNVLPQGNTNAAPINQAQMQAPKSNPQMAPQDVKGANPEETSEDPEGLEDAAYLTSASDVAPTAQSDNSKKLARLFDLMQNLSLYAETFRETLDTVELGLLDDSILDEVRKYRNALDDLSNKIHDYLIDVFSTDTYEKALYAYIMFRTELLVATKQLRQLLKLNEVDDDAEN